MIIQQTTIIDNMTVVYLYHISLTADETYRWAHKPNNVWACSKLAGKRLWCMVDQNGLCDITVDGKTPDNLDEKELIDCIADHLPKGCKRLWPTWE